jgi:oxalate decarboxylase/phosphoglucose isomerase-like protein (cupin superfamily)
MASLPDADPLPRVAAPPAAEFRGAFVRTSRPVVLTGLCEAWPARARWSLSYLAEAHGGARVTVARTRGGAVVTEPGKGLRFDEVPLARFVASLRAGDPGGYLMARLDDLPADLRREAPSPPYCEGAPWRVAKLWISAAGTTSALHFDMSDNLHTVIAGRKRFLLVSPDESDRVYPHGLFSSIPNGAGVDPEAPDLARFPRFRGARPRVAEVGPGETIFIPHGHWHHVRSLEPTIAVNWWWAEGARSLVVRAADAFKKARGLSR